jgi:DNA-binding MurR/RpiR family transcriptional regulator
MLKQDVSDGRRSADAKQPSLQSRIQEHYVALPESERKLADLILDFPGEIAAYSATELAVLAGASKAAVTRLTRRLGYQSFEEARVAARDARTWGSPVYLISKDGSEDGFAERLQRHVHQDSANITRTFKGIEESTFKAVVEALATAPRVWLLGYRNSYFLAGYARWQFIQVREDVHLLPLAGETIAEYMAELRPDDVLFVLGFRRRVPEIRQAMESAARNGIRIVFITDPTAQPNRFATWTISCEVRGDDPFDGYVSAISVLHFLSVALVERMGRAGREHLTRIESLHEEFDEFG